MVKSETGKKIASEAASGIVGATTDATLDKQGKQQVQEVKKKDKI